VPKQAKIKSYELLGGPFCGVLVVCVNPPEQVLLVSGASLHGLIDPVLELVYQKRQVRYEFRDMQGTKATYQCTGIFTEVGHV
jgi:hypothetical protein